ncbi:AraC family transcriptional regulator [Paenibacillus qinlingensis]|uniref:AraC-like DNA-binding protein n=1 Tax=Paenibacillus qinlingensis TaxID=1837343 RepID=A0ABU1NSV7_9BACL|nr:AraC family transcriptional regulator [Paenibacillus qinlingensis]MDR6550528.1 AraC-like DNA-binding protein [Paenibacillus qinlingensis]
MAPAAKHRWTYNREYQEPIEAVPELLVFGFDEINSALRLGYHEHHGYEFVFIERGKASWELANRTYETKAGEVFHTRPGEIHRGGFNVIEPSRFWWFILSPPSEVDWLCLPKHEIATIRTKLDQLQRIVHTGIQPLAALQRLKDALQASSPLRSTAIRQAIVELLLQILQPSQESGTLSPDLVHAFDSMIRKVDEEPDWRPTIEEMAEFASISPSHFMRTFRQYTGNTPMAFLERQRIKQACVILTHTDNSVLTISTNLGYASSQHFATVFKRITGVTPLNWRKTNSPLGI